MRFLILISILFVSFQIKSHPTISEPTPIIFILDASGSMWGQLGDKTKIEVAREVLQDLLAKFPDDQPLGLVAYGHRREGDCSDVEYILTPATQNKSAFIDQLLAIKPLGKTPLANSAEIVINKLRQDGMAARVILISDGIETCSGDLCELVTQAKTEGIEFVLHIVGFGIAESDKSGLKCAAEAGDGLYLDAEDGDQLANALETASETIINEEGPVTLTVLCTRDGELLDAAIRVYESGARDEIEIERSYDRPELNPAQVRLPTGNYDIEVLPINEAEAFTQKRAGVQIESGKVLRDTFDFSMGAVSLLCWQNGEKKDVGIKVYQAGTKTYVSGKRSYTGETTNPSVINLPPGRYDIEGAVIGKSGVKAQRIENLLITANQTHFDTLDYSTGSISILVNENEGALCDATVSVNLKNGKKGIEGGRTYTSENSNPFVRDLSPGFYDVIIKSVKIHGLDIEKTISGVEIKPGDLTTLTHNFESGILSVKTTYNGALCNASVSISSISPKKSIDGSRTYDSAEYNPKSFLLNPGKYEVLVDPVRVEGASRKMITVEVKTGETKEIEVKLE